MNSDLKKLAVYQHAADIVQTTRLIVDTFKEERESAKLKKSMLANAYGLPSKVAAAEALTRFSHRMEQATLIRMAARDLLSQTLLCKKLKLNHSEHLDLLLYEIEQFRISYLVWVKSFDAANDVKDEWTA